MTGSEGVMVPTVERPLRVVELFSGIGAQAMALRNLGIPYEIVGTSEIDEAAMRSYEVIHGPVPQLGDITELEHLPECDLVTYSFPCQDLSIAGSQRGMARGSGTRSALLWEVGRLVRTAAERERLPEALLMENVPAVLNQRNIRAFNQWISYLTDLGYTSSYAVLNATDFGVPQNRKRCFMVSALGGYRFRFPQGHPTDRRLRDVLEPDVDESYYLSDEKVARYEERRPSAPRGDARVDVIGDLNDPTRHESANRVYGTGGVSPTVITGSGGGLMPKIVEGGRSDE